MKAIRRASLFAAWVTAMACLFWWLILRHTHYVDFSIGNASYNATGQDFAIIAESRPVIMHFMDPDCPCNRFSIPHIAELKSQLGQQVHHLEHVNNQRTDQLAIGTALAKIVPATPAVAIWDTEGELRYFGPYSNGSVCGNGDDMIIYTLEQISDGSDMRWLSQEYVGCVCPWKTPITSDT